MLIGDVNLHNEDGECLLFGKIGKRWQPFEQQQQQQQQHPDWSTDQIGLIYVCVEFSGPPKDQSSVTKWFNVLVSKTWFFLDLRLNVQAVR